jgi:uncharacterized membrane protein
MDNQEEETFDFLRQRNQYDPPGIKHAGRNSDQECMNQCLSAMVVSLFLFVMVVSFGPVGTPAYDGSLKPFLQQDNGMLINCCILEI